MISSVLSRLFTMVTVIGGRGGKQTLSALQSQLLGRSDGGNGSGSLASARAALRGSADSGKCLFPPFLLQRIGWKTILGASKRRDILLEKDLQADTLVSNSIFKNRGVGFLCFSNRISMKDNCLI